MDEQTNNNEESICLGSPSNFWRFSSKNGFDLTRNNQAENGIRLETTTMPITIDPARSAVIIVDMQNIFIHPAIRTHETGLAASKQLLQNVIPAARKLSMQVIWLNWGLTQEDVDQMPPSLKRAFAYQTIEDTSNTSSRKIYTGFGTPLGEIELSDGKQVEGGGLLMRDTWNARLYDPLLESFDSSQSTTKPHLLFHKNRVSGLWSHDSPLLNYLHSNQICTLFFAGVNTDQCVAGTLQDALSKGFDCILMRDACGTGSPAFAQQCIEFNCGCWQGFMIETEVFAKNVDMFTK